MQCLPLPAEETKSPSATGNSVKSATAKNGLIKNVTGDNFPTFHNSLSSSTMSPPTIVLDKHKWQSHNTYEPYLLYPCWTFTNPTLSFCFPSFVSSSGSSTTSRWRSTRASQWPMAPSPRMTCTCQQTVRFTGFLICIITGTTILKWVIEFPIVTLRPLPNDD